MSSVDAWFPYRAGTSDFQVFAFPHAGAGSIAFSGLRQALSGTGVALVPAVLPGRERRLREAPHRDMDALLAEFEQMAAQDGFAAFQGDYALLGHCSGALIAFEIARILERSPCRNPQLLVSCSCLPPPLVRDTGMSRLPTPELFAQTASSGGTPDAILGDPGLVAMLERPLRTDFVLFDGYAYRPGEKLTTPILATRGPDDDDLSTAELDRWRDETSGDFSTMELGSGHWALTEEGIALLAKAVPAALYDGRRGSSPH
ncbi:thioesterase II family protein [Micromonospora sp. HK10]|uniref:thioesterase II family protein n=1 Tax=Micromonospora sp. HK10 TaxID=1538294 RepID=UPI0006980A7A|nr:alpha/beta fold hydrolase [Micromonospora sp. HK10]